MRSVIFITVAILANVGMLLVAHTLSNGDREAFYRYALYLVLGLSMLVISLIAWRYG